MRTFKEDVERAVEYHGHLCSGQCIGVKMARLGMELLGLDSEKDGKKIIVYVECDRCPADAIGIVTGCRVGKRTYRALDLGKIAATFINTETKKAVRIQRANRIHPADGEDMITFYEALPWQKMFKVQNVEVELCPCDMPGPPIEAVFCEECGEDVTDSRHVTVSGRTLCKSCAYGAYYKVID